MTVRDEDIRQQLQLGEDSLWEFKRALWFDKQIVPETGFKTLSEQLWEPLLSVKGATDPQRGLLNLHLLRQDETGVARATNAGILLCTDSPQQWLSQAVIMAIHYRGKNRSTGQLDAQEITGPLPVQIADAVKFVMKNMRVPARKTPQREEMPQYSMVAIFEALVNAVAHRDYSISSRNIRLSMFMDRIEIDSPGLLPNGMTLEAMSASQSTRNEVIASIFGRFPVGAIPGSNHRGYLMERRGDGVSIIHEKTRETAGALPQYTIVGNTNLVLNIPAARFDLTPANATVTVHSEGNPLSGVDILVLFPNKTWVRASTDEAGAANLDLYTTNHPMTVYAAAPGYAAVHKVEWYPNQGGLLLELKTLPTGGATIFAQGTGHLPGLRGRLNPIRDNLDRTYLYADNIAIDEGRQQPVTFRLGKKIKLTDAYGFELLITIIDITGRSALVEYQWYKP